MEELKRYQRHVLLLLCVIFISYIVQFVVSLPSISRDIIEGVFWLSLVFCLVITTKGVIRFSQRIGKIAYFFVLFSLISAIFAFLIDTIEFIKGISFVVYYICLLSSLVTGVVAMVKEERGLAKLSGFLLMLLFALVFMFSFFVWNISSVQFK